MTHHEDLLDEIVDERSATNPAFARMVDAAYERRVALRALGETPRGVPPGENPGRLDRGEG